MLESELSIIVSRLAMERMMIRRQDELHVTISYFNEYTFYARRNA